MNSLMPAARASSIAYWMSGRSTKVMISFGTDFVAGKNRVPMPATGKIALVTFLRILHLNLLCGFRLLFLSRRRMRLLHC